VGHERARRFNPAFLLEPVVTVRGTARLDACRCLVVGDGSAGRRQQCACYHDFTGGTVDALINYLCVGPAAAGTPARLAVQAC